jgi:hypothetical protein
MKEITATNPHGHRQSQTMLHVFINASKDRVLNIKFNIAKLLQSLLLIFYHSVVE